MSATGVRAFVKKRNWAWFWQVWPSLLLLDALFGFVGVMQAHVPALCEMMHLQACHEPPRPMDRFAGVSILFFLAVSNVLVAMMTARTFRRLHDASGALVARTDRSSVFAQLIWLLMLIGMLALLCALMWVQAGEPSIFSWVAVVVLLLIIAVPIALIVGLSALRVPEIFDRSPIVVVDEQGFFDRRFTRRPVAWADIKQLLVMSAISWPVIETRDDPSNRTMMANVYKLLGRPYLYVGLGGVDKHPGDILLAVDHFAPHLFSEEP
jgi:hypothetical protein